MHQFHILWQRTCKWMVHCMPTVTFLVVLQQRKIQHPKWLIIKWISQTQFAAHQQTQLIQLLARFIHLAGQQQNQIARFGTKGIFPCGQSLGVIKLVDRTLSGAISFNSAINQSLSPNLWSFYKICKTIQLFPCIGSRAFGTNTNHGIH